MGCASDDEYDPEFEEELDDRTTPEDPLFDTPTIASAQTDVFDMAGNQHAITPAILFSFANECCEEFGLADGLKEDVLRTAKLPPQLLLVRLYARTVAFGKNVQTTKVDSFLTSREFKQTISRRLQAGLLDPHISNYVEGTTARFVKHIVNNPASYEIPAAVQAQFMHSKLFSSAVAKVLSSFRGELQRKIQRSIAEKEDIGTLASRLAIHGFQMTQEHILRIAFLRSYYVEFTSKPNDKADPLSKDKEKESKKADKDKAETRFWSFIDAKLEKFHKRSLKDRLSSLERNLAKDKRAFPPLKGGAPVVPSTNMPEWQASVTRAISTMEAYQAATPSVGTQADDTDIPHSRLHQESREASIAPPLSTEPSSPINPPEVEEEIPASDQTLKHQLPPPSTGVYTSLTGGPGDMDIDSSYGNSRVPYQKHRPPASTSAHTTTAQTRRGAGQGIVRGGVIRHNPIGSPNHPSAASSTLPSGRASSRAAHPKVATAAVSQNPPGAHHCAENAQHDARYSDTAGTTLDHT
ncbi:unnamed protein product [Rhizoctonia solani]|uniref:Uncharacterized protein n=1 Tax=Rhizoctonia solani TaxID=456999 RepID=A0A8H3E0D8_9AGAM|nr:unnamed protein product [Rhizoctonia solani]